TDDRNAVTAKAVFNPFDPAFRANPHPFYDALREQDPVHLAAGGLVVLTRYDDVASVLRSNDFSRDVEKSAKPVDDPIRTRMRERRRDSSKSILNLDPPDHTRLRRLVSKSFTPSAIEQLRPLVQRFVDDALDDVERRARDGGSLELIDDLAFPVPFLVISAMLGMPIDRAEELRQWSQVITRTLEPTVALTDLDEADVAFAGLLPFLDEVIAQRRRNLCDDMLSSLLAAEESGDKLTTDELVTFVVLLYIAGHETTVNLVGNSMLALLRSPDQLQMVRDAVLDSNAIDELLRFDGPVQHTIRIPLKPVQFRVGDNVIDVDAGERVLTSLGAASHDPSVFAEPHSLNLRRENANKHLGFAAGIHYCLGSALAKLETQVTIESLLRRFSKIQLVGEPQWRDRLTIRGVDRLELAVAR
ncbi:MAG: cytochrome P450, partial [Actinomycetota bacterium]